MALRWKVSNPMTVVTATEIQHIADNGVVQIDTAADLDSPNLVGANVAYSKADFKAYMRVSAGVGAAHWKILAGVNEASGGESIDYTENGKNYRAFIFRTAADFTVKSGSVPFEVLAVGGGGGGGATNGSDFGHGGGGGQVLQQALTLPPGTYPIVVGAGGVGQVGAQNGTTGGHSSIGTLLTANGGEGGHMNTQGGPGAASPLTSTYTGTAIEYGFQGLGNSYHAERGYNNGGSDPAPNTGGGGSGQQGGQNTGGRPGQPGATGIVVIRHEIA